MTFPQHPNGRLKTFDEMTEYEREAALASLDDPLTDSRVQTAIIELYNGATVH